MMQNQQLRSRGLSPVQRISRSAWRFAAIALLVAGFAGCAAEMTYRQGKDLVAQGKIEAGIAKLKEASTQNPHEPEYRLTYVTTRDWAARNYVAAGDRMAAAKRWSDAEKEYRSALAISPEFPPAISALHNIETARRHDALLADAVTYKKNNDVESARRVVRQILAENPDHADARRLNKELASPMATTSDDIKLSPAYRKPITIDFKDVNLKQVFDVISRASGLNFIFDREVKTDQKTSIFLKNSTVAAAVQFTLMTNQLEQQVIDPNTVLIYPNTVVKQREYQETLVKSFFLSNADAKAVANTLKTILKSRDIVTDEKLNMVIVRDSPSAIRLAEKLVALHDIPEPEVMLEVEVLEVSKTRLQELGVQWPQSLAFAPLASNSGTGLTVQDLRNLNGSAISAAVPPFIIKAGVTDGDARILANPRIRARNHEKAKILIGERVPNITSTATATGFVSESVNYVDVGLKLEVEPSVHLDNDVAIKVALEVSNIVNQVQTKSGTVAYQIGTRTASTVLRLKDGENQVLAGLINDEDRSSGSRLPGIGELPVVGRLFGAGSDSRAKSEIVLSITPHLVRRIERPDAAASEFSSGSDTSLRMRFDAGGAGAAPPSLPSMPPPPIPIPGQSDSGIQAHDAALSQNKPEQAAQGTPVMTALSQSGYAGTAAQGQGATMAVADASSGTIAVASASAQLQAPASVRVGETFSVQLALSSPVPVTSVPAAINFDNRLLQAVSVQEGGFLRQGGAKTAFTSKIDPAGQILMTGTRTSDGGASAQGVFATVNFKATAVAASTPIQVSTLAPIGIGGQSVSIINPLPQALQIIQ